MKFCPYCGAELVSGTASFCSECGKSLAAENGSAAIPENKKSSSARSSNVFIKRRRKVQRNDLAEIKYLLLKMRKTLFQANKQILMDMMDITMMSSLPI